MYNLTLNVFYNPMVCKRAKAIKKRKCDMNGLDQTKVRLYSN